MAGCRLEDVEDDFTDLVLKINERRAEGLQPVTNELDWAQKGPLQIEADKSDAQPNEVENRHLAKFAACGVRCFDLARLYFARDFEVLGYPQVVEHPE